MGDGGEIALFRYLAHKQAYKIVHDCCSNYYIHYPEICQNIKNITSDKQPFV
jgi:hypothetical protein